MATKKYLTDIDLKGKLLINTSGGTDGYFLKTDGTGGISWASASGGGSGFTGVGSEVTSITGTSSSLTIQSKSLSAATPNITLKSGNVTGNFSSGSVTITSGNATGVSAAPGDVIISTGTPSLYLGSNIYLYMPRTTSITGASGSVYIGTNGIDQSKSAQSVTIDTYGTWDDGGEGFYQGSMFIGAVCPAIDIGLNSINPKTIRIGTGGTGATGISIGTGNSHASTTVNIGGSAGAVNLGSTGGKIKLTGIVIYENPSAPLSKSASYTLLATEIQNQLLVYTGTSGTITFPSGSSLDSTLFNDTSYKSIDFYIVNNATSGSVTLAAGTGNTLVGGTTLAFKVGAQIRLTRTGINAWTIYKLG
jgi:hypothetical protein